MFKDLRALPPALAAVVVALVAVPIWASSTIGGPWILDVGLSEPVFLWHLAIFWVGPLLLEIATIKRSPAFIALFVLEVCGLGARFVTMPGVSFGVARAALLVIATISVGILSGRGQLTA